MKLHRLNNIVHRDLGYFLVGTTLLYAISGLALNHADSWDPHFVVQTQEVSMTLPQEAKQITREMVLEALEPLGLRKHYLTHASPTPEQLKIYLEDGSVMVDLQHGQAVHESVQRRPVLFRMNRLHLTPQDTWRFFSDFFVFSLVLVTITGVFVQRGRRGLVGRGALLLVAGIMIPLLFLYCS